MFSLCDPSTIHPWLSRCHLGWIQWDEAMSVGLWEMDLRLFHLFCLFLRLLAVFSCHYLQSGVSSACTVALASSCLTSSSCQRSREGDCFYIGILSCGRHQGFSQASLECVLYNRHAHTLAGIGFIPCKRLRYFSFLILLLLSYMNGTDVIALNYSEITRHKCSKCRLQNF